MEHDSLLFALACAAALFTAGYMLRSAKDGDDGDGAVSSKRDDDPDIVVVPISAPWRMPWNFPARDWPPMMRHAGRSVLRPYPPITHHHRRLPRSLRG